MSAQGETGAGRVLVTGASSFIGCHLARRFAAAGYSVVATHARPMSTYAGIQKERLDAVAAGAKLAALDIRDDAQIAAILESHAPDLWVHHAGYATDYGSLDYDLAAGMAVNVTPLRSLYQRLEKATTGVLITGSSAEYSDGDAADDEDDACWPSTPYGVCKLTETIVARQLSAQYSVATRVARVYIPFGPLDAPNKLLAHVIRSLHAGQKVELSPCTQKRDFIGISDLTDGYLAMARDIENGGFDLFNLSSGQATPLRDLVTGIADALAADRSLLDFGARTMRPGEADVSYGDNAKARRRLKWTPVALEDAIQRDLL